MYFTAIILAIFMVFFITILLLVMSIRIKYNKLNILWPIKILKFILPFFSFTFFSQIFVLLVTVFDCKKGFTYESQSLKCRTGAWFSVLGPTSVIALFLHSIITIITNYLYFKPIFNEKGSNLLKKIDSTPDIIFVITKIVVNLLFIFDKEKENEHWAVIFILILFTGTNAYYNLYYQNRENKTLSTLSNIFCLITFLAYISLFVGKVFKSLQFTGAIYLFLSSIIIIIIFIFIYKNDEIDYIIIDYTEINNPVDFLYYISRYYIIIQNRNKSRNYLTLLKTLIEKIEQNCIVLDCPLNKYLYNLKNGNECPFLLNQYCQKLFEYGISKFSNDELLKTNYSVFLITVMKYKKKALLILNNIKDKSLSFQLKFSVYRTFKLIDKWKFSEVNKNNSTFEYRKSIQEFKKLIRKIILYYYDFISLLLNTKQENVDNFNKLHKIGLQIMRLNPIIEDMYNKLIDVKTDNYQIIKLYSEFVQKILKDEEKLEKCKKNENLTFSNIVDILEKDFSNFDLEVLDKRGNIPYLVISTHKEHLGNIVDLSMKACKIFGYTKNEIKDCNINILIPKIFHQKHDLKIAQQYEKHKLKFLDELNKKMIYFPNFIKKNVYGITKMRFLIELKLYIYFVKTEENRLVYIAEITNYNTLVVDLMKNNYNNSKCCILTDDNLLIQNFTSNCLETLRMNYADINSNYSIINYIKQLQEDYLKDINNIEMNMFSHIYSGDMHSEQKMSDNKKNIKNIIPPSIKKRIKHNLLMNKYYKKSRITWRIIDESNINQLEVVNKNYTNKNSQNIVRYSKTNIFKNNKTEHILLDVFMEVKNIIIDNKILGYYFYFTKIKNKIRNNNMSYIIKKNKTIGKKNDVTNLKLKKYQCKLKPPDLNKIERIKFSSGKNQLFTSIGDKSSENEKSDSSKKDIDKIHFNNLQETNNKKSLINSSTFIIKNNNIKNTFETFKFNRDNESIILTGEFVPQFSHHFTLNIDNLSFIKIKDKNNNQYNFLQQLKTEANEKIKTYKKILNFLSKTKSSSNESEESESNEGSSSDKIYTNSSDTNSNSLNQNNKEFSLIKTDSLIKDNKKDEEKLISNLNNSIRNDNYEYNSDINLGNNSTKSLGKKTRRVINFYKVNLNKIIFMYYDFNKEMIVEDNNLKKQSKMEAIMTESKNLENSNMDKEGQLSFFSHINTNKKNKKEKTINSKKADNINKNPNKTSSKKLNKIKEEKITKKRIYDSLNNHKSEPPVIRLKIFVYLIFIFMTSLGCLIIILDIIYLEYIKNNLNSIKYSMFLSYYNHINIYYIRELTLLNFNVSEIEGGEYINIPAKNKSEYRKLIKNQLSKLFLENQNAMKILYSSSSLSLSKKSIKILEESKLILKLSFYKEIMNYDILTALMQYSSTFYNLVSSTPSSIEQNHSDVYCFIYNNLNGYKKGINKLIELFSEELTIIKKEIAILLVSLAFLILIIFSLLFVNIIINFLSAIKIRGNYMKVFYGINEFILKAVISNCEDLLNKLKPFDEQNYHEEDIFSEDIDGNLSKNKNKNIIKERSFYEKNSLNDQNEKTKKISSFSGISFVILYGLFLIIACINCIFNGVSIINQCKKSITKFNYCYKLLKIHLIIIDTFNIYRELLFDNQSLINDVTPMEYLNNVAKDGFSLFSQNSQYLKKNSKDLSKYIESISNNKSLCNYYINDIFYSNVECEEVIGLITKYNFYTLSINFLEELKIKKSIIEYKLENEDILGDLTKYNYSEYINNEMMPRKGDNTNYTRMFRLNLFNNNTLHYDLNIIYFSIILPFIEENRNKFFSILSLEDIQLKLLSVNGFYLVLITFLFFCYFLPGINTINSIIYKTKNMLSIIPFSILSFQSDALILLNISNNK